MGTTVTDLMVENHALLLQLIELRKNVVDKKSNLIYNAFFDNLVSRFAYIVDNHTCKYKKYSNYDDLYQEGMLGLSIALNKFNPERSKNFFKIANWYIKTKVKRSACKFGVITVPLKVKKCDIPKRVYDDVYLLSF